MQHLGTTCSQKGTSRGLPSAFSSASLYTALYFYQPGCSSSLGLEPDQNNRLLYVCAVDAKALDVGTAMINIADRDMVFGTMSGTNRGVHSGTSAAWYANL